MSNQPNILFFMTDQMSARALGAGSQCRTPHLDALARNGVHFTRAYTTNAICSPARASLMTGLYPSTHGMWDCAHTQRAEWVDVPASRFTYFSHVLADAGYHNGYFGKWHVEQSGKLEDFGWHAYDTSAGLLPVRDIAHPLVTARQEGYRDFLVAGVAGPNDTRHPAVEQGIDFLRRHAQERPRQPFCCFVSTLEPHDPYIALRAFMDKYDPVDMALPATLYPETSAKPDVVRRMRTVWQHFDDAAWRTIIAAYWATISYIDHEVGRLLAVLRETGLDQNTIVVFTSDHGDMMGSHGLLTKGIGTPYEEVYNIPLIIRAPGIPGGREESGAYVSLVDLGPTLLDLCGLSLPEPVHGRSFRSVLAGAFQPEEWQEAYAEFFGQRFVYTQRITWRGDWKYVFSPGGVDELYHLRDDPHECANLAGDPAHRDRLLHLTRCMWRKMESIGDMSLYNSHYATLRTAPVGPLSVK